MGNRTESSDTPGGWSYSYTSNKLNQHTQISGTHASLPPVSTALSYDPHGNLVSRGTTQYQYDDHNRLTSIVIPSSMGVNQWRTLFTYDGFDRRAEVVEQTWNAGTSSWDTDSATRYIYDGMDVVQERRSGDNSVAVKYVRSGNVGGLLARIETAFGETPEKQLFYHYDGSGNVTQLTDSTESVVATYDYDAYGNLLTSSGVEANQPYRFSTKWFHARSALYDYGYRFYSPGMGRWINLDPIEESGGINLYGFVQNDPVNALDDYGHGRFKLVELAGNGFRKVLRISDEAAVRAIDEGEEISSKTSSSLRDALEQAGHKHAPRDAHGDFNDHRHTNDRNGGHFFEESSKNRKFSPELEKIKDARRNTFRDDFRNNAAALSIPTYTQDQHPIIQGGAEILDFFNPLSLPMDVAEVWSMLCN